MLGREKGNSSQSSGFHEGQDLLPEHCDVYRGNWIIAIKHAELQSKSGTSDQTGARHEGRIVGCGEAC